MTTLASLKEEFAKYITLRDKYALDVIFATLIGNMVIDRDPIWLLIIGASSGGKTTLIAPCVNIPHVHFIDDVTEKTFLSGYKNKGKESSLLRKIGSGIIAISDLTSILAKNPVSRGEILTQLKLIYDGKLTKETGTGSISWTGKIGAVCASTPDVYTYLESSRAAGERFLYFWLEQPTNQEIMDKQTEHSLSARQITTVMQELYKDYFESVQEYQNNHQIELKMTPAQRQRMQDSATLCVLGKATIHTDFKSGRPDSIPNIASVGRDSKIFDTLLHALQVMNCYEHDDEKLKVTDEMLEVVEKCAYSSINRERRKVLEVLVAANSALTTTQIGAAEGLGLEKDMVMQYLAPLHAVGMIKKVAQGGGAHKWYIEDEKVFSFVERVSHLVIDRSPVAGLEVHPDEPDLMDEYIELNTRREEMENYN